MSNPSTALSVVLAAIVALAGLGVGVAYLASRYTRLSAWNWYLAAKGRKKRKLNEKGKVKLRVAVTFTPTGGDPSTRSVKVKLRKRL